MAFHHDDPLLDHLEAERAKKGSPLIDEIANRTRVPGAPPTQPLSGSGRDTGSPVPPAGGVASREHSHDHTHRGLAVDPFGAARWGGYTHSHPHDHAVRRNPDDGSVESHDNAAHFAVHQAMTQKAATLRKMAEEHPDAEVRRGARELLQSKGSIESGQASSPVPGAPPASRGVTSPSGASAGYCPNRSCSCGGCGPSCTGDCCMACTMGDELDRRETMHELVKEAQHWQETAETYTGEGGFYVRQHAKEKVKALTAEIRKALGLDDDETLIRKLAGGEPQPTTSSTGIIRKAATPMSTFAITAELTKAVNAAVARALDNIERARRRS